MNKLRNRQLTKLRTKFESSKDKLAMTMLMGEAGIGKTFLIDQFLDSIASDETVLVSRATCSFQTGRFEPYQPFKELLKGLLEVNEKAAPSDVEKGVRKLLAKSVGSLLDVAPDLINTFVPAGSLITKIGAMALEGVDLKARVEERIAPEDAEFQLDEDQIHKQYLDFLKTLSSENHLVLILEDLQWLDQSSANLLLPMVHKLADCPVLLIGSYRSNEVNQQHPLFVILTELKRNLGSVEMDMDYRSEQERVKMLDSILDERPNDLDKPFRRHLLSVTNANPLFINELLQNLLESGQLRINDQGVLQETASLNWENIPERLEAVVLGRLAKLEEDTKSLLSSASVQGGTFLVQVLSRLDGRNERELLRTVSRALVKEHKLLKEGKVERLNGQILSQFHFSSGLVQHYLYNDLMESERMLYHEDVASTLEEIYGGQIHEVYGLVAFHYEKAEIFDKALEYYRKAGERSQKISAFKEAAYVFGRALRLVNKLLPEDPSMWKPVKLQLLVQKSVALKPTEGWIAPSVIQIYQEAYQLGTELSDWATVAPVTFGLWVKHLLSLEFEEALKFANGYLESAIELNDPGMILQAKISVSNTHFWMGNIAASLEFADQVLDEFDPAVNGEDIHTYGQDPRVLAYLFKILVLSLLGRSEEADELARTSRQWVAELKHPFSEAILVQAVAWMRFQEGRYHESYEMCVELNTLCKNFEFRFYRGIAYLLGSAFLIQSGDLKRAEERLETGYHEFIRGDGSMAFHSSYHILKARLKVANGEAENALELLEAAIERSLGYKELVYYPLMLQEKAVIQDVLGNQTAASDTRAEADDFARSRELNLFITETQ